ncbi:hypothetical protein LEP1GSC166_1337 [Leptospira kirschneri]|nr:hypothetical protein LEP1GSC166_1337 [Leptospira kirschneri]
MQKVCFSDRENPPSISSSHLIGPFEKLNECLYKDWHSGGFFPFKIHFRELE